MKTFKEYLEEVKGMSVDQIKKAVDAGKTVHWSNKSYEVVKDKRGDYLISFQNGKHYIGLTHMDGKTMNGKPEEFYIA